MVLSIFPSFALKSGTFCFVSGKELDTVVAKSTVERMGQADEV